jgi:hypothetical protein
LELDLIGVRSPCAAEKADPKQRRPGHRRNIHRPKIGKLRKSPRLPDATPARLNFTGGVLTNSTTASTRTVAEALRGDAPRLADVCEIPGQNLVTRLRRVVE